MYGLLVLEEEKCPTETCEAGEGNMRHIGYKDSGQNNMQLDQQSVLILMWGTFHQGSALSPCLFIVVLDTISAHFRGSLPWELLLADGLVVIPEREEEVQEKWMRWQVGMAKHRLKVNTSKREVMVSGRMRRDVRIVGGGGTQLKQVERFKYLGWMVSENGGSGEAIRARVKAAEHGTSGKRPVESSVTREWP